MASKKNKNLIIDKFWKKHNVTSKKTLILKKDFLGMLNELPLSEEPDYRRAVTKHRIGEVLLILARFPGLPFIKIKELTGHYNVILNRLLRQLSPYITIVNPKNPEVKDIHKVLTQINPSTKSHYGRYYILNLNAKLAMNKVSNNFKEQITEVASPYLLQNIELLKQELEAKAEEIRTATLTQRMALIKKEISSKPERFEALLKLQLVKGLKITREELKLILQTSEILSVTARDSTVKKWISFAISHKWLRPQYDKPMTPYILNKQKLLFPNEKEPEPKPKPEPKQLTAEEEADLILGAVPSNEVENEKEKKE